MRIDCRNTYDPLRAVILGRILHHYLNAIPEGIARDKARLIFDETEEDFSDIETTLLKLGVRVHRPNVSEFYQGSHMKGKLNEQLLRYRMPLSPRDNLLVLGNDVFETNSWQPEQRNTGIFYRDMYYRMLGLTTKGNWYVQPQSQECYFDAANVVKYNDFLFYTSKDTADFFGTQWFLRLAGTRYYTIPTEFSGHLDTHFSILRPGLLMTHHPKDRLPEMLRDWDIIQVDPNVDKSLAGTQNFQSNLFQDDDVDNTVLGVNVVSINKDLVMMYDHHKENKALISQFEKHGIDLVFVPFRHCYYFNQGLSCVLLDVHRDHG